MEPMNEPQPIRRHQINEVAPTSLAHLVGQSSVRAQVAVALEAAWADSRRFDHAILTGPPGVGKSALANIISEEMASPIHEVLGQSIEDTCSLNALLLAASDMEVVFIDECHLLSKPMQTRLYMALDKKVVFPELGGKPEPIALTDFTLLLGTTDEYRVMQPLRDRMHLNLRLGFYDEAELTEIIVHRMRALGWEAEPSVAPVLAARARGTPRIGLALLQAAYRCSRAAGVATIMMEHVHRSLELAEVDGRGLGSTETSYLMLLLDGPLRLNVIASKLGLPARTVAEVTEAFLLRDGLILKDDGGRRQLTAAGREHVATRRAVDDGGDQ